eukprot:gene10185-10345_t
MILCRAAATYYMASEQATGWRVASQAPSGRSTWSTWSFLLSMCQTSGGLQRVFEVASLQQPFSRNALLAGLSLLLQGAPALRGFRLAYTNAFFYSAHQVHDLVAAAANTLLSSLVPLPLQHQDHCSSMADDNWSASPSTAAEGALEAVLLSLNREAASSSLLNSFAGHMAALAAVFLLCNLAANFVALVLLPRMLSSLQLQLWCPAQPYTPYRIAGEVYEYL